MTATKLGAIARWLAALAVIAGVYTETGKFTAFFALCMFLASEAILVRDGRNIMRRQVHEMRLDHLEKDQHRTEHRLRTLEGK